MLKLRPHFSECVFFLKFRWVLPCFYFYCELPVQAEASETQDRRFLDNEPVDFIDLDFFKVAGDIILTYNNFCVKTGGISLPIAVNYHLAIKWGGRPANLEESRGVWPYLFISILPHSFIVLFILSYSYVSKIMTQHNSHSGVLIRSDCFNIQVVRWSKTNIKLLITALIDTSIIKKGFVI